MLIAEQIVTEAQRKGDLIGVRISVTDDEYRQDPWTLPPSRKRLERPIQGPLPERVQIVVPTSYTSRKETYPPPC